MQGLSELAVNAFKVMKADGLAPSLLALNSLINAFGEERRDAEAFAVLQYMKENVICFCFSFLSQRILMLFNIAFICLVHAQFVLLFL